MFRNIGIRFKTRDYLRWTSAVFRVAVITFVQARTVPRKCAAEYTNKVRENLKRFRSPLPLSPIYFKWKSDMGLAQKGFWRLHDNLLNNLQVFEVQKESKEAAAYMGGVPNGIFVPRISMFGGATVAKEIAMYGKKAEELRPLFGPTTEMWVRAGYWESQVIQARNKIRGAWR